MSEAFIFKNLTRNHEYKPENNAATASALADLFVKRIDLATGDRIEETNTEDYDGMMWDWSYAMQDHHGKNTERPKSKEELATLLTSILDDIYTTANTEAWTVSGGNPSLSYLESAYKYFVLHEGKENDPGPRLIKQVIDSKIREKFKIGQGNPETINFGPGKNLEQ